MVTNSNCKRCVYYKNKSCDGSDVQCLCKFCPRNIDICTKVKWCRETESSFVFEDDEY